MIRPYWFAFFVLVATTTAIAAKPAKTREASTVLHGLALLGDGQKDKAAQVLESIFDQGSVAEDRFQAALTLVFLDQKSLKLRKRHEYAVYLLRKSRPALEARDIPALLRIAGDGLFQAGDLSAAETHYIELATAAGAVDVDYAQFKMGWIDLNRAQPQRAFERWHERLMNGKGREQQLRLSLMRDLGRAWAETLPPVSSQVESLKALSMNEEERKNFSEGVVAGIRRTNNVAAFRGELFKSEIALEVFRGVLAHGTGLKNTPCEILPWLDASDAITPAHFETEVVLARLGMCQDDLKKRAPKAWLTEKITERLLSVYEKTSLTAMQRQPRAYLYKDLGRVADFCSDVLNLERENYEQTAKPLADAFLGEILTACSTSHERKLLIAHVLRYASHFRNTLFPALLVESLSEVERPFYGESFLAEFAPRPLKDSATQANAVWVELMRSLVKTRIERKELIGAQQLLTLYAPLETARFDASAVGELWLLLALAIPQDSLPLKSLGERVTQSYFNGLPVKVSHDQSVMAIALANRFGLSTLVWNMWDRFSASATQSSGLVSDLIQRTFVELLENKVRDVQTRAMIAKTKMGQNLISTVYSLEEYDDKKIDVSKLQLNPQPLFVKDLRAIAQLREQAKVFSKLRLKLDSRLAKKIESSVKEIQKQMKLVNSREWSHPKLVQTAKRTIADSCALLNRQIEELPEPAGLDEDALNRWRNQFLSIVGTIATWRTSLLEGA